MTQTKKVVLLDRDGVLNVDLPQGVRVLEELRIEPSAPAGVATLTKAGFTIVVITNQGAIGRGETTLDIVNAVNTKIAEAIAQAGGHITHFYVCPHRSEDHCTCRKPKVGLLQQAYTDHRFDIQQTWFLGDAARDVAAARAFGVKPALVLTGKGVRESQQYPDVPTFADVAAFADHLVRNEVHHA